MLGFTRVAIIVRSLHGDRTLTKTSWKSRGFLRDIGPINQKKEKSEFKRDNPDGGKETAVACRRKDRPLQ